MNRSSFLASGVLLVALAACGDDTSSTGDGGSSSSSGSTASSGGPVTASSSGSTSSSSSDGGSTSDGGGGDGGSGDGGSGGAGGGDGGSNVGGGGLGGNPSFEELCAYQNEQFQDYADELGCPLTRLGECELPEGCEEETIAFHECYYEFLEIDDCACLFDNETGEDVLQCPVVECDDEDDALFACLFPK